MKEEILRFSFCRTGVHPVREQVFPHFFLPSASVEQGEVSFILLRTVRQISRNFPKELKEYLQTKEKSR